MVPHFIMHQIKANTLAYQVILLIHISSAQLICILLIWMKDFSKLQKFMIS